MKILLLNGPPGCGKDTAASRLLSHFSTSHEVVHEKFSLPIKRAFAATMGVVFDHDNLRVPFYDNRENKDTPIPMLVSYRQWQIDFSEDLMKPKYGQNIFADLLLNRIISYQHVVHDVVVIVSDCGFQHEVDRVLEIYPDAHVIRIRRLDKTFAGDSRQWVAHPREDHDWTIFNNETKAEFERSFVQLTHHIIGST